MLSNKLGEVERIYNGKFSIFSFFFVVCCCFRVLFGIFNLNKHLVGFYLLEEQFLRYKHNHQLLTKQPQIQVSNAQQSVTE